ncbi:MAG: hypothetical protein QE271_08140 [Bacteriovoracaceae bacterium]|nr:hypothetical protein [Bacteriovoracaceae bacterium]
MSQPETKYVQHVSSIYGNVKFLTKILSILVISNMILIFMIASSYLGNTTVIMEKNGELLSFKGEKRKVETTTSEIKQVAENFIKRRYEWEKFDLEIKLSSLSSIVTSGLKSKIDEDLRKEMESFKAISQYVGKIDLTIGANGEVLGKFDKILRLTTRPKDNADQISSMPEKIPLLSETQIELKIVRGAATEDNPLGLYINSVTEYGTH